MLQDRFLIHRDDAIQHIVMRVHGLGAEADQRKVMTAAHAGHKIPYGEHMVAGAFEQFFQYRCRRVNALTRGASNQQIVHRHLPFLRLLIYHPPAALLTLGKKVSQTGK
ncbi:hypothetical protein SDC9_131557 [bioreactor metagenome]|uniref:Uncharacterized protein n=1 Tax=bioreactor metagenome TaxID=1076179 RepID=A0A645D5J4_9ZZZZ